MIDQTPQPWRCVLDPARPSWPGVLMVPADGSALISVEAGRPHINFAESKALADSIVTTLAAHAAATARIAALEAENQRLREAIEWALGERDDFAKPSGSGRWRYWWRSELRQRAGLAAPAVSSSDSALSSTAGGQ